LALDKGQEEDWFSSTWITVLIAIAIYTFIFFVVWEWNHKDPVVDIRLFQRRNFATAMFFTFVLGIVLFGTTVVIPQFLQLLLGYPAVKAGEAMAGGGIAMLFMMPVAGFLVGRMDPRLMMMGGFLATAASLVFIGKHLTLGMDFHTASLLRTYQAAGLAFIFPPSNTLAYVGIPREKNNQVSSLNSFVRNVGGSIGIALISAYVTRQAQRHQSFLTQHAVPGNPAFDAWVNGIAQSLSAQGVADATRAAYGRIAQMIQGQALTLAYIDMMMLLAAVVAVLAPMVFIMRRPKRGDAPAGGLH
jgi:DHA2 family multidrug resistance protein